MLTSEVKRKIDTARDILVGKIPDPKAQVEQITTALIYKFMDDMDKESIELGGKARFFTDKFEKYSWTKLMDPKLGGIDRLNLYVEAINQLNQNPNIPQLFRDIFKDAFLPYRSPETLNLFLKEINGFRYEHSEDLGDAYEYLLSVLGSQGDAGQFRTPRHIINFIVSAVDPTKDDSVLDPACGTAGFLISAYKHIERKHDGKDDVYGFPTENEAPLTPDERKKLIHNLVGYDISPDMGRISKVNMYLHGFPSPTIHEYDTLSSEDRWDDMYDVILANPPFMSPKGGIKPHKRFPIQANRSEVLFVSYILEHLKVNGRAGIIVPEGIIFKSDNANKQLRKMLVEDGLLAVVSLPPGVFNPYAGVKTSILIFDEGLAKKTKNILFLKISNDGHDLGAQRRPIDKNDLPQALEIIKRYKKSLSEDQEFKLFEQDLQIAHIVPKEKIAEDGAYNLSVDRYIEGEHYSNTKWPMVKLGDVCEIINGRAYSQEELLKSGKYPVLRVGNFFSNRGWYYSDLELDENKYCKKGDLLFAWSASFGPRIWNGEKSIFHYHIWKLIPDMNRLNKYFLYYVLEKETKSIKESSGRGLAMLHITKTGMEEREIPLPPLEVQEELVQEWDRYQKIIDGARQVVESWKPSFEISREWEIKRLGDVCDVRDGTHDSPKYFPSGIPLITSKNLVHDRIDFNNVNFISKEDHSKISKRSRVDNGDILFAMIGTIGNPVVVNKDREFSIKNVALFKFNGITSILNSYLKVLLESEYTEANLISKKRGGTQNFISLTDIRNFQVPVPDLSVQKEIVEKIEEEQRLIEASKKLIEVYEQKIKSKIAEVWTN